MSNCKHCGKSTGSKECNMRIFVSKKKGELNFGILWISLDGRIISNWFQTKILALKHYNYLKNLGRQPSFTIRLTEEDLA